MSSILGDSGRALDSGSEGTRTLALLSLQAPGRRGANHSGDSPRVRVGHQQG